MATSSLLWKRTRKVLTWLFFIAVIVLLVVYARQVNWADVWDVVVNYNRLAIFGSVALVVVSYLTYGLYDLIGRAYCGHKLEKRQVMLVSFICYAFNLTLSTWVGGVAMRYRLYSRLGLDGSTITRIFSLSIATNWLGYVLVAGVVFSAGMVSVPGGWFIGAGTLRITGIALLAFVAIYLALCAFSKKRRWTIKGQKLALPSLRMALIQFAVSSANWLVMGAIIWLLLMQKVDFPQVLGVLLISSIAGVIIHIPAGIGVLEAVFLALLRGEPISHGAIIAALLAYRVLYFIAPLLLALVLYLWLEGRAKSLRAKNLST
ncbi:lysylphosphatidylglycerol synthase domain-containing protein [Pseudomonas graminis]